jgi:hypothetical protein
LRELGLGQAKPFSDASESHRPILRGIIDHSRVLIFENVEPIFPDMIATRNKRSPTVLTPEVARKRRFRAALAAVGMSMRDFATAEGVSVSHVSQVLSGKRESRTMDEKIAAFTEKHLEKVA